MDKLTKLVFITAGSIFVALGVLGMVLPLIPTTPFLLLGAACYARSSEKFYNWLVNHKCFGKFIKNYFEGKGISLKGKVLSVSLLWVSIGYTIYALPSFYGGVFLVLLASGVTAYLLSLNTYREEE
ncbi:MAG: YbaN family protein [Clostridia bacterium]|nr:YbaN family protein [Clostridia bacterium]